MKYVDTPPILAILLWKQKTPPHIRVKFKDSKIGWVSYTLPQNRWKWSTPPQKKYTPPLDIYDIFPK